MTNLQLYGFCIQKKKLLTDTKQALQKYGKQLFQILILLLVSISVSISVFFLLSISNKVTDETDFFRSRNRIYTTDTIDGMRISSTQSGISTESYQILPGNLLLMINNKPVVDSYEMEAELSRFRPSDDVLVWVVDKFNQMGSEVVVKANNLNTTTLSSFENALIVLSVQPDGVADRAGIERGDIVTAINDITISPQITSANILDNLSPGSIAKYDIIRYDEEIEVNVRLAKFGLSLISLSIFVCAMLCYFIGGFVGLKRPLVKAARYSSLAIIGLGNLIIIQQDFNLDDTPGGGLLGLYLVLGLFVVPPLLLHSTYYLPEQNKRITERRWPVYIPYALGIATLVLILISIAGGDLSASESIETPTRLIFGFVLLTILFGIFVHGYLKPKVPPTVSSRTLKASMIVVPLIFILTQALSLDYGELNRLFVLVLIVIPIVYFYTMIKSRLVEVNLKVGRNIQYGLVYLIVVLGAIITGIVSIYLISQLELEIPNLRLSGYELEVLDSDLSDSKSVFWVRFLVTLMTLGVLYVIYRVYKIVYKNMQRFFNREPLDRYSVGMRLEAEINSENGFAKTLPAVISELMQIHGSALLIIEKPKIKNIHFDTLNSSQVSPQFDNELEIIETLEEFDSPFRTEFVSSLDPTIADDFPYSSPVLLNGQLVAVILAGRKLSDSKYKQSDIDLLQSIAQQTAQLWEKQRLYNEVANRERVHQEIELARLIQKSSLPTTMPAVDGLDIAAYSNPAYEVGGDFYDFNVSENYLTVVMGDVSGKGTTAAMYMSKAQGMIAALNEMDSEPGAFLKTFNKLLEPYMGKGDYLTALSLRFDISKGTAEYARAGHVPLLHYDSEQKKIIAYPTKGMGVGFHGSKLFNRNLESIEIGYTEGDVFVVYTDGLAEARSESGEEFGEERLEQILVENKDRTAEGMVDMINANILDFTGERKQFDDLSVCIIKIDSKVGGNKNG